MVRIRLTRTGRKNLASYKIVVTPRREKRDSRSIELIGHYHPHSKELVVDKERANYWLGVGAQPSETVKALLVKAGVTKKDTQKTPPFNKKPGKKATERSKSSEAQS